MSAGLGKEFWDTLITHTRDTWAVPELNRRAKAGTLSAGFTFNAPQIVVEP